jgi:flavodoxin I
MANKKIGIFYGSSTGQTEAVAEKLYRFLGEDKADLLNVDHASPKDLESYPFLVLGTPTWALGDMQDDWEEFIDELEAADLKKKKVALFGLGNQDTYPDSFADGVGVLYNKLKGKTTIVGEWPNVGYQFNESLALKGKRFVGLILDQENQANRTDERLQKWVDILLKEFK